MNTVLLDLAEQTNITEHLMEVASLTWRRTDLPFIQTLATTHMVDAVDAFRSILKTYPSS